MFSDISRHLPDACRMFLGFRKHFLGLSSDIVGLLRTLFGLHRTFSYTEIQYSLEFS